MTQTQKFKEIEKIWKKHATGMQNMICTYLPHANQVAFFNELITFFEANPIYPEPITEEGIRQTVKEILKENK